MLDRNGKAYAARARGLRAVLVTVADAANRDGEHAHPGLPAMIEGSLYGRSQVMKIVRELVEDGWLAVEEEGRGRGHATVYRLPRMAEPEMVRSSDHSPNGKGPIPAPERSDPEPVKVRSGEGEPLLSTDSTGSNIAPAARTPLDMAAHALAVLAMEQPVKPIIARTANPFVAVLTLMRAQLQAGRSVNELERAISAGIDVWTTQGVNTAVARLRPTGRRAERHEGHNLLVDTIRRAADVG